MITEEQVEQIVSKLIERIQEANTKYLKSIGSSIKAIRELTPAEAQKLIQILKYGGRYEDIVKEIAKYTNLNIKDIDEIFKQYSIKDQMFNKQFYEYRNRLFMPYEENMILQRQTQALANIVKNEMYNFTRSNVLGYTINGKFYNLRETYNKLLDEAFLNVGQGKETFDSAMTNIMKKIGGSGLKTIDYESGRSVRLDSTVRMHLKGRLRELHNENQKIIGEEIDSDGIEISVHGNPAPDHEYVQGRQFSINHYDENGKLIEGEYEKLQKGEQAKDYKGKIYTLDHDGKNGYRPISEMNCYHYVFNIVLGVNEPEYSDKQLNDIIKEAHKKIKIDGKEYTKYECTQIQRNLERKIREQKDTQILAKASGNEALIGESQQKITQLTNKYREISQASGLPTKMQRTKVSGYKRKKVEILNNYKEIEYARKNNQIWHSTENLEEIIKDNKIITPSLAIGKEINGKVKYGTQFIEFKPELLENVDKNTLLYKGDGGNKFAYKRDKFDNLMQMLKNKPETYNELKFNNDLESIKYIKKVYIRQDESNKVINLLKENNIEYEIYKDLRPRPPKKQVAKK